jgi:hypothetical protein
MWEKTPQMYPHVPIHREASVHDGCDAQSIIFTQRSGEKEAAKKEIERSAKANEMLALTE